MFLFLLVFYHLAVETVLACCILLAYFVIDCFSPDRTKVLRTHENSPSLICNNVPSTSAPIYLTRAVRISSKKTCLYVILVGISCRKCMTVFFTVAFC